MSRHRLLFKYPIISDQVDIQELSIILNELELVLGSNIPGAVVELGCYVGTTSLFIARLLQAQTKKRDFHVYDSFEGLPEKTKKDESPLGVQFKAGELNATKKTLVKNFRQAELPLPVIHKVWFESLKEVDVPGAIAFAFLDGDYYESIMSSLQLIRPKLASGATVIIDDYNNQALPGARRAVDEWQNAYPLSRMRVEASLAILDVL